jgi:soluble lytic murein transglycosylase-like protein
MNIDPKWFAEYIQLQMMRSLQTVSFDSSDTESAYGSISDRGDSSTDFTQMLQQLMQQTMDLQTPFAMPEVETQEKITPANVLLQRLAANQASLQVTSVDTSQRSKPTDYDSLIQQASREHGVDTRLIKAVIQAESSFRADAVSHAGAKGLMQLMDRTGQSLGVNDPFDPQQNINGGTKYLSQLLRKYNGQESIALAAYNAGPGRVDRLGIKTESDLRDKYSFLPKETQRYIDKVLNFKENY